LQANTNVNTATLSVTGTTFTTGLQANTNVNTATLSVTGTSFTNNLQANTNVNTATLSVTGTSFTNNLQANTNITTGTISASGVGRLTTVQANTNVNTATLSVTGTSFTNTLQANTNISTGSLAVSGIGSLSTVQANTNVNTATLSVTGTSFTNTLQANTTINTPKLVIGPSGTIDANSSATSYFNNVQTLGQLSVGGNFVITGTTVYTTNTFTLNAGSSSGQLSYFNVNRGSSGANASIRWNEAIQNWDMLDVTSSNYYRILTNQYLSDSTTTANSTLVATSAAVNSLQGALNSANSYLTANVSTLNTTINSTNTWLQSFARNATNIDSGTLNAARLPLTNANPGTYGGSAQVPILTVDNTGRITGIANTAVAGVSSYSYNPANNTFTLATSAGTVYNSTINQVADFTVTGNLVVNGATTTVNTSTIQTKDSLIKLANGNAADSLDLGFYGQYNSTGTKYAGLIRQAAGNFYLLQGLTTDPTANSVTFTTANRATLNANLTGGTVSGLSSLIAIADGGTNNNTFGNGQQVVFADSKITTRANTITNVYGLLSSSNTITGLTYNSYGELISYTTNPIAITSSQVSGLVTSATTDTTNASNITSGTLPNARLVSVPNSALANSTISGVALGSSLFSLTGSTAGIGLSGSVSYNGSSAQTFTITSNASSSNGSSTLVSRDINGNFNANTISANVTGNITGNAGTVTNGVYTNGLYTDPTWLTINFSKISAKPTTLSGYGITDAVTSTTGTALQNSVTAAYNRANTSANSFIGTSGSAIPTNGSISLTSTNGVTITGSSNTVTINTAQDISSTASPTFNSPSFTGTPLSTTAATGTSNTMIATTAFVSNTVNSGITFTHSITGNAGTVTNGVYTNGSYNNPDWIIGIANTKIVGTITSSQIANITSGQVTTALGFTPYNSTNPNGYISGITSGQVTTALGFTPYNSTNPNGYITSSGTATAFSSTTLNSQFNSIGVGTAASTTAGEIRATNNITAYYSSDKKFKENITDIDNAVEIVSHIGGKLFDWTDEYINTHGGEDGYFIRKSDFGVIAQDVQAVFPRAVRVKSDDSLAVDYEKLCALAFAAIRELKAEIDALKGI
jgi:hypothetical protein